LPSGPETGRFLAFWGPAGSVQIAKPIVHFLQFAVFASIFSSGFSRAVRPWARGTSLAERRQRLAKANLIEHGTSGTKI
jgi:hypothetical protein